MVVNDGGILTSMNAPSVPHLLLFINENRQQVTKMYRGLGRRYVQMLLLLMNQGYETTYHQDPRCGGPSNSQYKNCGARNLSTSSTHNRLLQSAVPNYR